MDNTAKSIDALSMVESKNVAACMVTMKALAMRKILEELLPHKGLLFYLGIDSQVAFLMATNPMHSQLTRRIKLR